MEGFDRLLSPDGDWFLREVSLYWKRLLKRLDATSRTVICLVEPGSCFVGFLAEVVLAADRSYMLEGTWPGEETEAMMKLTSASAGLLPMANDLTRLETRFWGDDAGLAEAHECHRQATRSGRSLRSRLVTDVMDDIDWKDELR